MEKQQFGQEAVTDSGSSDALAPRWVAPLQSMTVYSINEFTQNFSNPGDDGSGILTGS
ncbi:hypothetical protein K9B35_12820 [Sphingomonas sp. R647]|uniref:hypothetical protein n=1 Tax=Sphingomonas sp. R647 TaxID=2875233 RepID=UPI001CD77043|nr:hypothetical protein [Sphingomonas sp. R647]MCA1198852.1 hypothetical protein [Sphingomonas sp. R647]